MALLARTAAYRKLGDFASARKTLAEVEPRLAKMLPPGHSAFGALASERALLARAQGDFPAALAEINREMAIVEGNNQNAFAAPLVLTRRSELELDMHLVEEARTDAARAVSLKQPSVASGTSSNVLGNAYLALGRALLASGKAEEAGSALASAVEQLRPTLGSDHPQTRLAARLASTSIPAGSKK
jgi:tetratricopeptide (TPR) repeat protein